MPIGQQYLRLILSRWRLVFGLIIACTAGAWLFSVLVLANKPTFDAAARLNIVPTSEELGYANRFVRGSTFDGGGVLLQTYAEFAHTRPVVAPIVDRYIKDQARIAGITEAAWIQRASVPSPFSPSTIISELNYGATPPAPIRDQIIDAVIKYTLIESVEGTYLMRINVSWDDAPSAAWFANALADAIIDRAETAARASGGQLSTSLTTKLLSKKAELAETLARSRAMKASIGVVDLDRQKQALFEARIGEQSQLTSDRATLKGNQSQVAGLQKETGGKLSPAQVQLEQSLAIERPRAAGMAAGIGIREKRIADIDGQIAALGRSEDAIKTLDGNAAALQAEVAALTERSSFTEIENLANAPKIQIIERAIPPLVRSSPKVLLNTVLGFVAGCALAGCALLMLGAAPARRRNADAVDREDLEYPDTRTMAPVATPERVAPVPPPEIVPEPAPQVPPARVATAAPAPDVTPLPIRQPAMTPAATPAAPSRLAAAIARPWSAGRAIGGRVAANLAEKFAEPTMEESADALALAQAVPEPEAMTPPAAPVVREPAPERPTHRQNARPDAHLFGQILPQPVNRVSYDDGEQDTFAPAIAAWLAGPLAADGRPVLIASDGSDQDAQNLYRLLYRHLRQHGVKVMSFDATEEARVPVGLRDPGSKPLIYGGGMRESGRIAVQVQSLDDIEIVIAAMVPPGESAIARATECRQKIGGIARRQPYVIAVSE